MIFISCRKDINIISIKKINNILKNNNNFTDRTVNELLNTIPEKYNDYIFIDEPPFKFIGCIFYYNKFKIFIYTYKPKYVKTYNFDRDWDLNKFNKEKINEVKVVPKY